MIKIWFTAYLLLGPCCCEMWSVQDDAQKTARVVWIMRSGKQKSNILCLFFGGTMPGAMHNLLKWNRCY